MLSIPIYISRYESVEHVSAHYLRRWLWRISVKTVVVVIHGYLHPLGGGTVMGKELISWLSNTAKEGLQQGRAETFSRTGAQMKIKV